jgi:hypothetical protein
MDLIWFHRVLIAAAILFFGAFGLWELALYRAGGTTSTLLLGIGSMTAAVLLAVYLRRLRRILKLPK